MNFVSSGVIGADVSFYQDNDTTPQQVDFSKMVEKGASFAIVRAGQNLWADSDWKTNWRNAKAVGLLRGAYWFYDSRAVPEKQAELFANQVLGDPAELEMWVDLEETYGGSYAGYVNWKKFIYRLQQLLPTARIGIYTSYGYIRGKIPASEYAYFSQFPLWLAWYTYKNGEPYPVPEQVTVPVPWKECLYWQWGTPAWGLAWGCESIEIDQNIFNGTMSNFDALYKGTVMPIDHFYLVVPSVNGETRTIRKSAYPNINGMKIGQINAYSSAKCLTNDVVVYTADVTGDGVLKAKAGDRWLHVYETNGALIDGWIAEIHLGKRYLVVQEIGTPPTPTADKIEIYKNGVLQFSIEGTITYTIS